MNTETSKLNQEYSEVPYLYKPDQISKLRYRHVKQTQQLLKINEKIKAAIVLNKIEKLSDLSEQLKYKQNLSKVRRAQQLRHRFNQYSSLASSENKLKQKLIKEYMNQSLSIDIKPQLNSKTKKKKIYIQEQLHQQIIRNKYEKQLEKLMQKNLDNPQKFKEEKQQLIKQISKALKKKYIQKHLQQQATLDHQKSYQHIYQNHQKYNNQTIQIKKLLNQYRANNKRQSTQNFHATSQLNNKTQDKPYILQTKPKAQIRRLSQISKQYQKSIEQIHYTLNAGVQKRVEREKYFFSKIRDPKQYYKMINKGTFDYDCSKSIDFS